MSYKARKVFFGHPFIWLDVPIPKISIVATSHASSGDENYRSYFTLLAKI
ncbi:hypothetical protein DOT_4663 [Desulfosporosinus sp. OT]|nr:hypothetical protein DOT_4663 [Desulfosporosinus sp. OT]